MNLVNARARPDGKYDVVVALERNESVPVPMGGVTFRGEVWVVIAVQVNQVPGSGMHNRVGLVIERPRGPIAGPSAAEQRARQAQRERDELALELERMKMEGEKKSDGGCCGCIVFILAIIGFLTLMGWWRSSAPTRRPISITFWPARFPPNTSRRCSGRWRAQAGAGATS